MFGVTLAILRSKLRDISIRPLAKYKLCNRYAKSKHGQNLLMDGKSYRSVRLQAWTSKARETGEWGGLFRGTKVQIKACVGGVAGVCYRTLGWWVRLSQFTSLSNPDTSVPGRCTDHRSWRLIATIAQVDQQARNPGYQCE